MSNRGGNTLKKQARLEKQLFKQEVKRRRRIKVYVVQVEPLNHHAVRSENYNR